MIEPTEFTEQTLKAAVWQQYGLQVLDIRHLTRGSANLFQLTCPGAVYILKEFQSKFDAASLQKELHVITYLGSRGLPVPESVPCLTGKYFFFFHGKPVIMQRFIAGETKEKNTGTQKELLESAKYLGRIVNALEEYPYNDIPSCRLSKYGSMEAFQNAAAAHAALIEQARQDPLYGGEIVRDLTDKLALLDREISENRLPDLSRITVKKSHGDYSVMQFIYEGDTIKAILDFVNAAELPVAWEIFRSYSYIDRACKNGTVSLANLTAYVKDYRKYSDLNPYDLQSMPYIYLNQLLTSTYGYKQYLKTGNTELLRFGQARTRFCRYLSAHAEEISRELLRI